MKKSLLLFVLALLPIVASADPVKIGDLWYNLISKSGVAEVAPDPNSGYTGDITIPSSVPYNGVNYTVTKIKDHAFSNNYGLTSVTIRNGVTSIGDGAFQGCSNLTSVSIPSSVTSIGSGAFMSPIGLTSVNITDLAAWCGISFANNDANPLCNAHSLYLNGTKVQSLVIPTGVTSIGDFAFYGCSDLSSVTIHGNVKNIGNSAFSNCNSLSSITIHTGVENIDNLAFFNCSALSSLTIPNSVTCIGDDAFSWCSSLISVSIGSSVESIGSKAFYGCNNLTSLTIPNSVTSIGVYAFGDCSSMTSLIIGNGLKDISAYAFDGCNGLTSVTIGDGVSTIGSYAFRNCGLTSVTIPSNVLKICDEAFAGCVDLADVYCEPGNVTTDPVSINALYTEVNAFKDSYQESITLHVPSASIAAYKAIEPWKYFKGPVALSGTTPPGPTPTKCDKPTISYNSTTGTIDFACTTAGVEFVSSVTSEDFKSYSTASITLTQKYTISVYATKAGMDNSDTATMDIIITGTGQAIVVGDMDGNGTLNATDIVKLVNKIMGK